MGKYAILEREYVLGSIHYRDTCMIKSIWSYICAIFPCDRGIYGEIFKFIKILKWWKYFSFLNIRKKIDSSDFSIIKSNIENIVSYIFRRCDRNNHIL